MSTKPTNKRVTQEYLVQRTKVAEALTEVYLDFVDKKQYQNADLCRFETTKFLGGRQNLFPLTDPDSLFLL